MSIELNYNIKPNIIYKSVTSNNNTFVAVGENCISYSNNNGVTWTSATSPNKNVTWNSITYGVYMLLLVTIME